MGLIDKPEKFHYQFVPYANVVFDHKRDSQDKIFRWLRTMVLFEKGMILIQPQTGMIYIMSA